MKVKPGEFGLPLYIMSYEGALQQKHLKESEMIAFDLLSIVKSPRCHRIYIDNFHFSNIVLEFQQGFFITGIREYHITHCPVTSLKILPQDPRGIPVLFDDIN